MVDALSKHAQSMVKAAFAGRFLWDPVGDDIRLLDSIQMLDRMTWDWSAGPDGAPRPHCCSTRRSRTRSTSRS